MGCCEVKKEFTSTLELDLNTRNDCSFNDISISSNHCLASLPQTNANYVTTPNSPRERSISLTYPNTLERAFLVNSPSALRITEISKAVVILGSEESYELGMISEENKDCTVSLELNK